MTTSGPREYLLAAMVAEKEGAKLRQDIAKTRASESFLAAAIRKFGGWSICPGCSQSCTGAYLGKHGCFRCQVVVG